MPPEKHALLSASSSYRWLNCTPSARLSEMFEDTGSAYALEGSDAHLLCEARLKQALGIPIEDPVENLTYYDQEMEESALAYRDYVLELLNQAKTMCSDPQVFIEQRLDFSNWVEGGFGTSDCCIVADGTMFVIDMKYGRGIPVLADSNPQMMLYSLGLLNLFDFLYDIREISMNIFQPRLSNVSEYTISVTDLLDWAENTLKPAAELAFKGLGEFHCGEWCQFCKAKYECRERAEANLALAKYEFAQPPLLSDEEIETILTQADEFAAWISDIRDYAFKQALAGKVWNGFKLVAGRSVRKYTDDATVATVVTNAGYDPYERKLMGITEMTKMLGKGRFEELLGSLVFKPPGKPTLVAASDKRPALNIEDAKNDFDEI